MVNMFFIYNLTSNDQTAVIGLYKLRKSHPAIFISMAHERLSHSLLNQQPLHIKFEHFQILPAKSHINPLIVPHFFHARQNQDTIILSVDATQNTHYLHKIALIHLKDRRRSACSSPYCYY